MSSTWQIVMHWFDFRTPKDKQRSRLMRRRSPTFLQARSINHWTKSLIASADGTKLYVGVGSNSNIAEHGMDKEEGRAAIWEIDAQTGKHRVFASGLRNPVGLA